MVRRNKASTIRSLIKAITVWALGLGISIGLGAITDIFLSPEALRTAEIFQESSLLAISSFTPESLFRPLVSTFEESDSSGSVTIRAVRFFTDLYSRESKLGVIPSHIFDFIAIVSVVLSILVIIPVTIYVYRDETKRHAAVILQFPFILAATAALIFSFFIVALASVLSILKWIAVAALFAFGGLTSLAGVFAIAGTLSSIGYFILIKSTEKRLGEALERSISRFTDCE